VSTESRPEAYQPPVLVVVGEIIVKCFFQSKENRWTAHVAKVAQDRATCGQRKFRESGFESVEHITTTWVSDHPSNRAGASGNIGTLEVVRAKADGYTLLLQNVSMATNYAIQGRLPYVPANDLTSILFLGSTPHIIVAHPKISVSNLQELMALIQKNPGIYAYGSCGIGSPQHFTMEVLKQTESLDMMHLGYKGCAPALTDVVGGQVPVAILSANLAAAYVNTGRLKAIGVTSSRRYGALPNVPTINEQGIKGFDYSGWYALMGPANMPADVVVKITVGVGKVLDDPAVRKTLDDSGIEVKRESAEQLSKTIADDSARYFNLARKLNLKAE